MSLVARKTTVSLHGVCTIEDVEPLLKWLLAHPGGQVQLKDCVNLHTAVLQTLLAGQAKCVDWPADACLCAWLEAAMQGNKPPAEDNNSEVDKGN